MKWKTVNFFFFFLHIHLLVFLLFFFFFLNILRESNLQGNLLSWCNIYISAILRSQEHLQYSLLLLILFYWVLYWVSHFFQTVNLMYTYLEYWMSYWRKEKSFGNDQNCIPFILGNHLLANSTVKQGLITHFKKCTFLVGTFWSFYLPLTHWHIYQFE